MACASVTSFGSYLDDSTGNFFTNPKNRFSQKCTDIGFLDKILKAADPVFDFAEVIAESNGASADTIKGIVKGRNLAKAGRDATAFFNIFQGSIPALIQNVKNTCALIEGLWNAKVVSLTKGEPQHNETAMTSKEKWASLGEQVGKGVGVASFIAGFGICRPIGTFEKYISRDIDSTASKIGKAFPTMMMVNHIGGVVGSSCGLVFQELAYRRAMAEEEASVAQIKAAYSKKMLDNGVALSQKVLELVNDILLHTNTAAPAWARIPINLTIGALSITKEWIK